MTKGLTRAASAIVLSLVGWCGSPVQAAGPEWVEVGDAGPTLPSSQVTFGVGQITRISGMLAPAFDGADFEDVFAIRITNPATFMAAVDPGMTDFDVRIQLLDVNGFGVLAAGRDSGVSGAVLLNAATDGSGAAVGAAGVYYIAISGDIANVAGVGGREPHSVTGQIFDFMLNTEISGPDGVGGADPLDNWMGVGQTGAYSVQLVGCAFAEEPPPQVPVMSPPAMAITAVMLVIVGVVLVRRV